MKTIIKYCGDNTIICDCENCPKTLVDCSVIKEIDLLTKQHDLSITVFKEANLFERTIILYTFKPLNFVQKRFTERAVQCREAQGIQR